MLSNFSSADGIAEKRFEITAQIQQEAALATRLIQEATDPNLYVPSEKMTSNKEHFEASANARDASKHNRLRLPYWRGLLNEEGKFVRPMIKTLNSESR